MVRSKPSKQAMWAVGLSAKERDACDEYLGNIKPYWKAAPELSEHWCLKFLSVRQYDVKKAVTSFKAHVEWRLENDIANIMRRRLAHETQCYLGRDVSGRPVLYMRLGSLDVNTLTDKFSLTLEHILLFHVKQQEFMRALCEESSHHEGKIINKFVYILDLSHTSLTTHLSTMARSFFTKLVNVDSRNYPEALGSVLLINTSRIFPVIWTFVKNGVDPKTRERIEVFGSAKPQDKTGWPARVRQLLGGAEAFNKWSALFDVDEPLSLGEDGRLPCENPTWAMLGLKGPAKPSKFKVKKSRPQAERSEQTDADDVRLVMNEERSDEVPGAFASTSVPEAQAFAELDAVLSLEELEKKQTAINALNACLEAEGLLGAVQVKANPSWQCVHCKKEFPLVQLMELQDHENECARNAALKAQAEAINPTQKWFNATQFRDVEYRSRYQNGGFTDRADDGPLTDRAAPVKCCVVQ